MVEEKKQTELQQYQAKYPDKVIKEAYCLDKKGEEITLYIAVPSRKNMTDYLTLSNTNMYKAEQKLIASCLLSEQDKVSKDDTLWGSVIDAITQVIPESGATIKN